MSASTITVSIVSHGHGPMVTELVSRLRALPEVARVVLTFNIPEDSAVAEDERVRIVRNAAPRGFGANHNAAFRLSATEQFCVMNPDIVLREDVFPALLECMTRARAGLVAPRVHSSSGHVEDSIRRFPSFRALARKAAGGDDGRYHGIPEAEPFFPDWVAGMFMLFDRRAFEAVDGFDEGFFLYYEDVDICARLWRSGIRVAACPGASVVHDAQRASRRNLRHMRWHAASMLRYFLKHGGRLPSRA